MSKKVTLTIENVTPELADHLIDLIGMGMSESTTAFAMYEKEVKEVVESLKCQLQAGSGKNPAPKPTEGFICPTSARDMAVRIKRFLNREAVLASFEEACKTMGGGRWCDDMTMKEFLEVFAPNGIRFHVAKTLEPGPMTIEEIAKLLIRMESTESPQKMNWECRRTSYV